MVTNHQRFHYLIHEAIKGGWDSKGWNYELIDNIIYPHDVHRYEFKVIPPYPAWAKGQNIKLRDYGLEELLFRHNFAKALFPLDGLPLRDVAATQGTPYHGGHKALQVRITNPLKGSWQYHLGKGVLADNALEYFYNAVISARK